jgi:hypothetical protein
MHAEDVVRPCNHKWAYTAEQSKWISSYFGDSNDVELYYERRAPTYGTCEECWASGPSYQPCQECDKVLCMPLELRGYIIDSQTMGEKMKKPHHTARAGLTYNQICTDTMTFNRPAIKLKLDRDFNKEHSHWVDNEDDYQFAPHQKSYAIRELHRFFFENMIYC